MFKSLSNRSRIIEAMPITEASEEELLAAAMQYNEAALGELYDRYEAKIYSYIFRRTGDQPLAEDLKGKTFFRGSGCETCNNTGYKGRVGLFELMIMNNELRDMIMRNASTDELREAAKRAGMVSLRDAGMKACFDGVTSAEEVIRETIMEA